MPVQVNEIIIRAVIAGDSGGQTGPSGSGADREAIIADCVEQVLEILREKGER
ncbi:MAG: DUF5908 family protein [Thermodesulfovibrionales bacterium]|jgi:hypothetical protein